MAGWGELEAAAPTLAIAGRRLIAATGIAFLATTRLDGAPRLHPVVPVFAGEGLYVAIGAASPKRDDLRRDNRYALHASLGPDDEEFALDGFATEIVDPITRQGVAAAAGHVIHVADVLFELHVTRCLHTIWERVGQSDTRPIRQRWPVV